MHDRFTSLVLGHLSLRNLLHLFLWCCPPFLYLGEHSAFCKLADCPQFWNLEDEHQDRSFLQPNSSYLMYSLSAGFFFFFSLGLAKKDIKIKSCEMRFLCYFCENSLLLTVLLYFCSSKHNVVLVLQRNGIF